MKRGVGVEMLPVLSVLTKGAPLAGDTSQRPAPVFLVVKFIVSP